MPEWVRRLWPDRLRDPVLVALAFFAVALVSVVWLMHTALDDFQGQVLGLQTKVADNSTEIGKLRSEKSTLQNQILRGGGVPDVPVETTVPRTTTTTRPKVARPGGSEPNRTTSTTEPPRSTTTTRPSPTTTTTRCRLPLPVCVP